jgi:hypothetical protein
MALQNLHPRFKSGRRLHSTLRSVGPFRFPTSLRARGRSANANAFSPHDFPPALACGRRRFSPSLDGAIDDLPPYDAQSDVEHLKGLPSDDIVGVVRRARLREGELISKARDVAELCREEVPAAEPAADNPLYVNVSPHAYRVVAAGCRCVASSFSR